MPRHPYKSDAEYIAGWKARCVIDANGCWLWQGFVHANGYAGASYRGTNSRLHRSMHIAAKGPIPAGWDVCHTCDVRRCINPDHLYAGTRFDNMADMSRRGRSIYSQRTHCPRGHEYTPENTRVSRTDRISGQRRGCKACARIRHRVSSGWSTEEAVATPVIPSGTQTKRRDMQRIGRVPKKLNETQARRAKFGDEHAVKLAREFGVTDTAIRAIRNGRTWRHI